METTFIYFLRDPTDLMKGYVGKAHNPKRRLTEHYRDRNRDYYNARWINSLIKRGLRPKLEILDEVPRKEGSPWEAAYIEYFLESGYSLTNTTLGGEGGPSLAGEKHPMFGKKGALHPCFGKPRKESTPEARANMSAAQKGRKHSAETRAKQRAASLGKKFSLEHRTRISLSKRGLPWL